MTTEDLIDKARDLLFAYYCNYESELDDVHWVEQDSCSIDGDYCRDCIKQAVRDARKRYLLEQRALPVGMRDEEFSDFDWTYNYGGGCESDSFRYCDTCCKSLDISILPNEQELEYAIEDVGYGITNHTGWQIYSLLYNFWGDCPRYKREYELTIKLAKKVIGGINN